MSDIQLNLNSEEIALVKNAIQISEMEKGEFITEAILKYAQNILRKERVIAQTKDWSQVASEELKNSKAKGAADEKILRSFQALTNHNDNIATVNSERWYIGNVTLRQLSGCNGQLVSDWIKRHQLSVDDHNNKYGLGQYHNKGRGDVTNVISWYAVAVKKATWGGIGGLSREHLLTNFQLISNWYSDSLLLMC